MVADWIVDGHAPGNVLLFELQRFAEVHNTNLYLRHRTVEAVGRHYQLQYPFVTEFKTCRKVQKKIMLAEPSIPIRMTPLSPEVSKC